MKKLCLFRHAKSTYASLGTDDVDRPLHEVGFINAPMMGHVITEQHKFKPDLILTSNAKRALQTSKLVAEAIGYDEKKIQIEDKLYEAGVEALLNQIQLIEEKYKSVLLIGHNPGLTLLANFLTDQHIGNLATCGSIAIEFNTKTWDNITDAENKILFTDEPKNHQEEP